MNNAKKGFHIFITNSKTYTLDDKDNLLRINKAAYATKSAVKKLNDQLEYQEDLIKIFRYKVLNSQTLNKQMKMIESNKS